jgi:enoyl-CoA hydratase/carnithine racemase
MSGTVSSTVREGIATIEFVGGPGNALSLAMVGDLTDAIGAARNAKLVVLQSAGEDFCLGRDPRGGPSATTAIEIRDQLVAPILGLYDAIASLPIPIVCAAQGRAVGLGCALAAACDITIAADNAKFKLPEMERNLPPTLAISAMMRKLPEKSLAWLVYSMCEIGAAEARQLGIVSSIVAPLELGPATRELADKLALRSRAALVAVKDYLRSAPLMPHKAAADFAAGIIVTVMASRGNE